MSYEEIDAFLRQAQEEGGPARVGGRPQLVPRGAPAGTRSDYTRASSFADKVQSKEYIHTWRMRMLARGIGLHADLAELAAAETYLSQKQLPDGKTKTLDDNRASGKRLDGIIERALDRVGASALADRGTSVHGFAEDPSRIAEAPEALRPYLEGYHAALARHGIKVAATERFVANDHVMAAGTFDNLVWWPHRNAWVMGDIKTSPDLDPGFAVQVAIYANAELYDTDTDERAPLESLTGGEMIDRSVGLIFKVRPEGTRVYEVDLAHAWELTKMIHAISGGLHMDLFAEVVPGPTFEERLRRARDRDDLTDLMADTPNPTDEQRAAANRRWKELPS